MEKLKAFIEDPKNTPKVVAVFGVVLLLAGFFLLKSMGIIGGGGGASVSPDMTGGMPPGQTTPDMSGGTTPPPGPGTPTPGPTDASAPPTTGTPAPDAAAGGVTTASTGPMLPYRKDPFLPFAGRPTRKDVISLMVPNLRRPRIAPAPVTEMQQEQEAAESVPPQPFRRMSGVLWNGKVSAILETNGETDIVRPGMELNRGGSRVRVESITQDSVILKTLDTRTPMTITVGMAGSVTGNSATGATAHGSSGPDMMQNGPY